MAQPQPRRGGDEGIQHQHQHQAPPAATQHHQHQHQHQHEPIRYGDAFGVKGELAGQAIAPRDAAAMRSAESTVPGVQVPQESGGGFSAGAFMESAAAYNQAVGAVGAGQASDAVAQQGINVTQDAVPGGRIVTEFVAGQMVGQYAVTEAPLLPQQDGAGHKAAGNEGGAGAGHGGDGGAAADGGRHGATTAPRRD